MLTLSRFLFALCWLLLSHPAAAQFQLAAPLKRPLGPANVALVTNTADPDSQRLTAYYAHARGIPDSNIIKVSIPGKPSQLDPAHFAKLKADIDSKLNDSIRAVVFVWTAPYSVGCNSITAAYTLGYQAELCKKSCDPSQPNPYFNTPSKNALLDYGLRLSMLLPTLPGHAAEKLVDRGVQADRSYPKGDAYFLITSDKARSSRKQFFPASGQIPNPPLRLYRYFTDSIKNKDNIMFYFTGMVQVEHLDTLGFLPGAVADHLTSAGGDLLGKWQMSSLRWLEAGATGSYGAVSEPCNHWQKFPNPSVLINHYLNGDTLIEAYWKSVAWPGQGVFIGEALAAPYRKWLD